jgi:ABC-type Fe3+/spermidine/putrescine transport system ATPase subunit
MATLELDQLTKHFGPVTAVDQVTFSVEQGSVVGFLGPNGAGKTTTLRMLLGLVSPTSGTATINGRPYRELPEPRHVVGAVLEAANPYPGRSARDHLRIEALAGNAPRSRVDEVLDLVDLTEAAGRRVGQYSLGMRQRLGLATALLAAVGVGIGSLFRAQLAGVIGVFVWCMVIESILGGSVSAIRAYLPYTAATTLGGAKLGAGAFGPGYSVSSQ